VSTSVSSTSTPTPSISNTLGAGSGVDFTALASQLVDAQFASKLQALTTNNTKLTAQISGVSQIKSGITSFSSSLTTLVKGGSLSTQPTSSNTSILNTTALAGAKLNGFSASVEVRQLATAQSASSGLITDKTASVGTGMLTLTLGTATVADGAMTGFTAGSASPINIAITSTNSSLTGIAAAINARNAGVTATVVSDVDGSRLLLKGPTGASQAFTLTATENSGFEGLSSLNVGVGATGTTIGSSAKDAIVAIDGVALKRPTNSINDLISGVQLDLVGAAVGTTVTLGTASPSANISQSVSDFVDTYNQLLAVMKQETDPASGSLYADPAAKSLARSLAQLTLTKLSTATVTGAPTTLADIGVATNRDGTLSVNADRLSAALTKYPAAVEAMFADGGTAASGNGLSAALSAISTAATSTTYGLGASAARYTKLQSSIADDQAKITDQEDKLRTRLTAQFAATDARVASYKATQDYLKQQVDAWNSSKG
jgi:flagellar hook-associated protein 2